MLPLLALLVWFGLNPGPTLKVSESLWKAEPKETVAVIDTTGSHSMEQDK
jgi:hypothetical protein